jgi:glycosyltransferase involved in cell wall biosynthesis
MRDISVVIPTYNRRARLFSLLGDLSRSLLAPREILVVDSSDEAAEAADLASFGDRVRYLRSEKSVCVQRNLGIREATGSWIFLCDDDVEVPADYLSRLAAHVEAHPRAGAVSGLFLERADGHWVGQFPITSWYGLLWRRIFQLGIWGEIQCRDVVGEILAAHYRSRGNHISSAGWPVLTDFQGPFFRTPVYSLGAALVRKDWLTRSPFDERLDRHGYGDNYGVALGFPAEGIHVVTEAFVHHHKEQAERPRMAIGYTKRILALDLFIASRGAQTGAHRGWLLWSLFGNTLFHAGTGNVEMCWASLKTLSLIAAGRNPYLAKESQA